MPEISLPQRLILQRPRLCTLCHILCAFFGGQLTQRLESSEGRATLYASLRHAYSRNHFFSIAFLNRNYTKLLSGALQLCRSLVSSDLQSEVRNKIQDKKMVVSVISASSFEPS